MLETIGYTPQMARCAVAGDAEVGRVLRAGEGLLQVLTEGGLVRVGPGGELLARAAVDPGESPVPGDWVMVRHWPDARATVTRVLPRRGTIPVGPAAPGRQLLCAHVDVVAVAVPPGRAGSAEVAAWVRATVEGGMTPVVVSVDPRTSAGSRLLPFGAAEVVRGESWTSVVPRLRDVVGGHRTLAVLGPRVRDRMGLQKALAGTPTMHLASAAPTVTLVLLPGGGVVVDPGPTAWVQHGPPPRLAPGTS